MRRRANVYESARQKMVDRQVLGRGVRDERVLQAMSIVPRHLFVPPDLRKHAYDDRPLPIGRKQTISQPFMVGLMTYLLNLNGSERVLEIGTGSGYQAAVLSQLCQEVHTIEQYPELAERAEALLRELGYHNVFIHVGDGSLGWPPAAPYQGILVTAAAPRPPDDLLGQLDDGGRLVIPLGGPPKQRLEVWHRTGDRMSVTGMGEVSFVPLRGSAGWSASEWDESQASSKEDYV